jgi:hypothetical protein
MKYTKEVRNGHIDEQNTCHITGYFTKDENEQGRVLAFVDLDNGKVHWIDPLYQHDSLVMEAINEAKGNVEKLVFVDKQFYNAFGEELGIIRASYKTKVPNTKSYNKAIEFLEKHLEEQFALFQECGHTEDPDDLSEFQEYHEKWHPNSSITVERITVEPF